MNIIELQSILHNLTGLRITNRDLAIVLSNHEASICRKKRLNTDLTEKELNKIETYYKVKITDNNTTNFNTEANKFNNINIMVKDYTDIFGSCGTGTFIQSENYTYAEIPKTFIQSYSNSRDYSIINACGDSMYPYIHDKDKLIIEHYNGEQIQDNSIYIFRYCDNLFVKRLVFNIKEIVILSDNELYKPIILNQEDLQDFQIIGKIVGLIRHT